MSSVPDSDPSDSSDNDNRNLDASSHSTPDPEPELSLGSIPELDLLPSFAPNIQPGQQSQSNAGPLVLYQNPQVILELPYHREGGQMFQVASLQDPDDKLEVSAILNRHLRPYQRSGVRFLFNKCYGAADGARGRIRGAILADDMGLGKTVQVISLLSALLRRTQRLSMDEAAVRAVRFGSAKPERMFLIVAPASVLLNWEAELNRCCND